MEEGDFSAPRELQAILARAAPYVCEGWLSLCVKGSSLSVLGVALSLCVLASVVGPAVERDPAMLRLVPAHRRIAPAQKETLHI